MDIVITLAVILATIVAGWYMFDYLWDSILGLLGIWVIMVGVIALALFPVSHLIERSNIQAHISIQQTAEYARDSGDGLEGVAFRMKIADTNAWLSKAQYWNTTVLSGYVPDAVDDLEPIK